MDLKGDSSFQVNCVEFDNHGDERRWVFCPNFSDRKMRRSDGPAMQEVEVHFEYGSTNFQYVYALGDQIQIAIAEAKVGEYDGHALPADGSEGRYFIYGPDAEAIFKVISPVLEASPLMRGARSRCTSGRAAGKPRNELSSFPNRPASSGPRAKTRLRKAVLLSPIDFQRRGHG